MNPKLYLSFFLLISLCYHGQNINWVKKTTINGPSKGLVCDKEGNIYQFGSHYVIYYDNYMYDAPASDTAGSFLCKFSQEGNLLQLMKWSSPFWIQDMVYDGSNSFYFTGSFMGSQNINGTFISSMGNAEGFVGKITTGGDLVWMTTFGGNGSDFGNAVTLSAQNQMVVVTGGISGSFNVNGHLVAAGSQRSVLVAGFNTSDGKLLKHHLLDFNSSENYFNSGSRITSQSAGYYLLANREASGAAPAGDYVFLLDDEFNISMQKLVISNSCGYGFQSGPLVAGNSGKAFVGSFCSEKYGGQGLLQMIDADGHATVVTNNADGSFHDGCSDKDQTFVIATAGASVCPCPENNFGYQVLRCLGPDQSVLWETRAKDVTFTKVARSNGKCIVAGEFLGDAVTIGNTVVSGDMREGITRGTFLIEVSDPAKLTTDLAGREKAFTVNVFPNPSGGLLNVQADGLEAGEVTFNFTNLLGDMIYQQVRYTNGKLDVSLKLPEEVTGIVFLRITAGDFTEVKRILIVK